MKTNIAYPWEGISSNEARRVNRAGKHDYFWVRMPDGAYGLLLKLKDHIDEIRPLPNLRNISLFYRDVEGQRCFCMQLIDKSDQDLFETLCRDVVAAGEQTDDPQMALGRSVRRTLRWHYLLRGQKKGMSPDEQRGLVGELFFLRCMVEEIGPLAAVESWKGPEGSAKDFELYKMFFEIKSRRSASQQKITINSETQLMDCVDGRLFLWVQDIDTSFEKGGKNLKEHVGDTALLFNDDIRALDIWEQRLAATAYSAESVEEDRRWHIGLSRVFEVSDGFPRLVPPLPVGVEEIRYSLSLDHCLSYEKSPNLKELLAEEKIDV